MLVDGVKKREREKGGGGFLNIQSTEKIDTSSTEQAITRYL